MKSENYQIFKISDTLSIGFPQDFEYQAPTKVDFNKFPFNDKADQFIVEFEESPKIISEINNFIKTSFDDFFKNQEKIAFYNKIEGFDIGLYHDMLEYYQLMGKHVYGYILLFYDNEITKENIDDLLNTCIDSYSIFPLEYNLGFDLEIFMNTLGKIIFHRDMLIYNESAYYNSKVVLTKIKDVVASHHNAKETYYKILEYIYHLVEIYKKWLDILPDFTPELAEFKKEKQSSAPFLIEYQNKYIQQNIKSVEPKELNEFLRELDKLTDEFIEAVDISEEFDYRNYGKLEKAKYSIIKSNLKIKNKQMLTNLLNNHATFVSVTERWLIDQKEYIDELLSLYEESKLRRKEVNLSFTLLNSSDKTKQIEWIADLMSSLVKHKFISNQTKITDFKRLFENKSPRNKIEWISDINALSAFIKVLHDGETELVKDTKYDKWKIAINFFFIPHLPPLTTPQLSQANKYSKIDLLKKILYRN